MTTETQDNPTAVAAATLAQLPTIGEPLAGGVFAGITTRKDGTHCAVVLLADKPEGDGRLTWKKALRWAEDLQAELPTRPIAALLFANVGDSFQKTWHWTSESFDGSCAWDQTFNGGGQGSLRKSSEGHARAVRLIPLNS